MRGIDTEVVGQYLDMVPLEIREMVKALSSDQKWAVYIVLVTEGRKNFTELKELFDTNPNTMTTILKALVDGGLVARKVDVRDAGDRRKVYYEPTSVGRRLLIALYEGCLPPVCSPSKEILDTSDMTPSDPEISVVSEPESKGHHRYDHFDAVPDPRDTEVPNA